MSETPYPIDNELTAIAVAFKNPDVHLIADDVMPKTNGVDTKSFKYTKYDTNEAFSVPDTKVGRKSDVNQVSFSGVELAASAYDYGLGDFIPADDVSQGSAGRRNHNPVQHSVMMITHLMQLDREVRVANNVFNEANYNHNVTVAAANKFSKESSDPLGMIEDALNAPLVRPNVMTIGQAAWSKLRRHAAIISAIQQNSGTKGLASVREVADLFELQDIFVGASRINMAKKGQRANIQRVWGDHLSLTYRDRMADAANGMPTWGMSVPYGQFEVRTNFVPKGVRGGTDIKVVETLCELVIAPEAGYFMQNVI